MRRLIWVLILAVLAPALGLAQTAKDSWDNLRQLRPGQKIQVVDMNLKSLKGKFVRFSDEAISLRVKKDEISIERLDVLRVNDRGRTRRARNALIGTGMGVRFGYLVAAAVREPIAGLAFLIGLPVGAGVGAAVPSHPRVCRAKRKKGARTR